MTDLESAKTTISSYDETYNSLLRQLITAKQNLVQADAILDSYIASNQSNAEIQAQNVAVTALEVEIQRIQGDIKNLHSNYDVALEFINSSFSLPDPESISISPFIGLIGPTGEQGPEGPAEGPTGPTGPPGMELLPTSSVTLDSLNISTNLYASEANIQTLESNSVSTLLANIGQLNTTDISVTGTLQIGDITTDTATIGVATISSATTDFLTVTNSCTTQGILSASNIVVTPTSSALSLNVGPCTSTAACLGSLSNYVAYIGSSNGGIVFGIGTSGTQPYIAASKTPQGSSLSLDFYTAGTLRMSIGTSGVVNIPSSGSLTIGGQDVLGIGYGQSWTDVNASRAVGTIYQNSTTKPIMVKISISATSANTSTNILELGVGTSESQIQTCDATSIAINTTITYDVKSLSCIVPVSQYYKLSRTSGSSTIAVLAWCELR